MACPFFFPLARFDDHTWTIPPRLPLGDPYTGECRAHSAVSRPDEPTLRQLCNRGYGRGPCERFPEAAHADAVRFHVTRHEGTALSIQYVFEKDCWPLRHGVLEYSDGVVCAGQDAILERQASAFAESYLRRASC